MLPSLLYLDRYRNEGTREYSPHAAYTEAEERYRPDSVISSFDLPVFHVPTEELNIYTANPESGLLRQYTFGEHTGFCVHPQLLDQEVDDPYLRRVLSFRESRETVRVSPSSSTRTLYVDGYNPPHAVKVHFPFRVSRYGRRMRDEVVEQALNTSRELQDGIGAMGPGFAFLREVLGVTLKSTGPESPRGENWGYLVREMTPFPVVREERWLVPGFSLYGRDFFDPRKPPLLFELAGRRNPLTYVLEEIMFPIIRHWAGCFLGFGLLLEPHGQNVLLEVGTPGRVSRIVHRDLNLGIDNRRRRDLGIFRPSSNSYNQMETGEFNSITYDKFMGGHFFDPLVEAVREKDPRVTVEDFRDPCRREFARVFPENETYLPRTVQYFSERRDPFGKPLFQDTGEPPVWRP